jgi:UDP-glucose:tetrahydrobiopterin glucosyltransferase
MARQRILIVSTPVGPLGSGVGGGVELTLHSLVLGLSARGHHVEVVAPAGSLHVGARVHQVEGACQVPSQTVGRDVPIDMPAAPVLGAMWELVRVVQDDFDVVLNLAYDWLPMYLTPFLRVPVAHLVSMGSLNEAMDDAVVRLATERPESLAVHSQAQADTFPDTGHAWRVLASGIAVERYDLHVGADQPPTLAFIGRIAAEKGIDDVFALSAATGLAVKAWGLMQDQDAWDAAGRAHPEARVSHEGFLATDDLQAAIGGCAALVMTPKWVEAFGNVAIEAMACGVPVVAYRRGGPAEIIDDGVTGWLVEPDDLDALVAAVGRLDELDRLACRRRVEEQYSTEAFAVRVERWLHEVVAARHSTSSAG